MEKVEALKSDASAASHKAGHGSVCIVPTLNRPEDLAETLEGISGQSCRPALVLVVDASRQSLWAANAKTLSAFDLPFRHLRSLPWASHQRDVAIGQLARNDYLIHCVDDDVTLAPDYFEVVEGFMAKQADCVLVGGVDVHRAGRRPSRARRVLGLDSSTPGRILKNGVNVPNHGFETREVEWLSGCVQSFRGQLLPSARFVALESSIRGEVFGEDVRFSVRLANHGSVYYLSSARYTHRHSEIERAGAYVEGLKTVEYRLDLSTRHPGVKKTRVVLGVLAQGVLEMAAGVVKGDGVRKEFARGLVRGLRRGS